MQDVAEESQTIDFGFLPWHNQAIESKRLYNLPESSARDVDGGGTVQTLNRRKN
ncbi:MAG: hypothetical protein HFG49_06405 [Lachnospiraceae bacterium]|nr:hypothetical protein [Lachnospiraceae bacterium]